VIVAVAIGCSSASNESGATVKASDLRKADSQMRDGKGPGVPSDTLGKAPSGPGKAGGGPGSASR